MTANSFSSINTPYVLMENLNVDVSSKYSALISDSTFSGEGSTLTEPSIQITDSSLVIILGCYFVYFETPDFILNFDTVSDILMVSNEFSSIMVPLMYFTGCNGVFLSGINS